MDRRAGGSQPMGSQSRTRLSTNSHSEKWCRFSCQLRLRRAGRRGKAQGVGSARGVLGKPGAAPGAAARRRQAAPGSAARGWDPGLSAPAGLASRRVGPQTDQRGFALVGGPGPSLVAPICLRDSLVVPAQPSPRG